MRQKFGRSDRTRRKRDGRGKRRSHRPANELLKGELQKEAEQYGIKVDVIDMLAYGMADGKKAYEQALSLIGD